MPAVVLLEVIKPGGRAEEVLRCVESRTPTLEFHTFPTGNDDVPPRVEVYFPAEPVTDEQARASLEAALDRCGGDARNYVVVHYPVD